MWCVFKDYFQECSDQPYPTTEFSRFPNVDYCCSTRDDILHTLPTRGARTHTSKDILSAAFSWTLGWVFFRCSDLWIKFQFYAKLLTYLITELPTDLLIEVPDWLAYQFTYLLAYLLAYLNAYFLFYLLTSFLIYLHTCLPTNPLTCLLVYLLAYLLTYLFAHLLACFFFCKFLIPLKSFKNRSFYPNLKKDLTTWLVRFCSLLFSALIYDSFSKFKSVR